MPFEGCDNWAGILLKLQKSDLSRIITDKCMLSFMIISEHQSRRNFISSKSILCDWNSRLETLKELEKNILIHQINIYIITSKVVGDC